MSYNVSRINSSTWFRVFSSGWIINLLQVQNLIERSLYIYFKFNNLDSHFTQGKKISQLSDAIMNYTIQFWIQHELKHGLQWCNKRKPRFCKIYHSFRPALLFWSHTSNKWYKLDHWSDGSQNRVICVLCITQETYGRSDSILTGNFL
jgi:hypothetical protein